MKVTYVGECTRPVRYRFNEHLSDARLRKTDTPLGEHIVTLCSKICSEVGAVCSGWGFASCYSLRTDKPFVVRLASRLEHIVFTAQVR